jgi:hypothetical protein
MRTTYFPALALACILALTACASDKLKAQPTTLPATTVELPTTTAPAPTTTTVAATTTIPATTTTAAEPTPSTTPDVIAAVKQAVLDYESLRYTCWQDFATCDPATYARGAQLDSERKEVARGLGRNARLRHRLEDPAYWAFESVQIAPDGTAIATACFWDTDVLEGSGGSIINGFDYSNHDTVTLANFDGSWWVTRLNIDRQVEGINECGARP